MLEALAHLPLKNGNQPLIVSLTHVSFPQVPMLALWSTSWHVDRGPLGGGQVWMRSQRQICHERMGALIRGQRAQRAGLSPVLALPLPLLSRVRVQQEGGCLEARERASPESHHARTRTQSVQPPEPGVVSVHPPRLTHTVTVSPADADTIPFIGGGKQCRGRRSRCSSVMEAHAKCPTVRDFQKIELLT